MAIGSKWCFEIVSKSVDSDENRLSYWLEFVKYYAFTLTTRSPLIVVIGHADQWKRVPKTTAQDVRDLAATKKVTSGLYVIDRYADPPRSTNEPSDTSPLGLDRVRHAIEKSIDGIGYVFENVDPAFMNALRYIETPPIGEPVDFSKSKYVQKDWFGQMCNSLGATDSGQPEQWLKEMRDLGAVHWVGDRADISWQNRHSLAETIFNPSWVKRPAYLVVSESPAETTISHSDLLHFLRRQHDIDQRRDAHDQSLWGQLSWNNLDENKLLQLLIAYETVFESRVVRSLSPDTYLVPDRLPDQQVKTEKQFDKPIEWKLNFLPPGSFSRFVAAWPAGLKGHAVCRCQALLTHHLYPTVEALVSADIYSGAIQIRFNGGDLPGRERFLSLILAELHRLVSPPQIFETLPTGWGGDNCVFSGTNSTRNRRNDESGLLGRSQVLGCIRDAFDGYPDLEEALDSLRELLSSSRDSKASSDLTRLFYKFLRALYKSLSPEQRDNFAWKGKNRQYRLTHEDVEALVNYRKSGRSKSRTYIEASILNDLLRRADRGLLKSLAVMITDDSEKESDWRVIYDTPVFPCINCGRCYDVSDKDKKSRKYPNPPVSSCDICEKSIMKALTEGANAGRCQENKSLRFLLQDPNRSRWGYEFRKNALCCPCDNCQGKVKLLIQRTGTRPKTK